LQKLEFSRLGIFVQDLLRLNIGRRENGIFEIGWTVVYATVEISQDNRFCWIDPQGTF